MIKKKPLRKCVACNKQKTKNELIRVVINKEKEITVDYSGKLNGRGAYLCKDPKCITLSKENSKLNQALKTKVEDNIYEEINKYVEE